MMTQTCFEFDGRLPMATRYCYGCGESVDVLPPPKTSTARVAAPSGMAIDLALAAPAPVAADPGARPPTWRRRRPIWLVALLMLGTFGLYLFYWYYTTWRELKRERADDDMHPFWHAASLFVPLYSLFQMHEHADTIRRLAAPQGHRSSLNPGGVVVLAITANVIVVVSRFLQASGAAEPISLVALGLQVVLIAWQQATLNRAWATLPGGVPRFRIHWVEGVVLGVATLFWGLVLWGLVSIALGMAPAERLVSQTL